MTSAFRQDANDSGDATVYLVDDDPDVREAIAFLLEAEGIPTVTFGGPAQMLEAVDTHARGCLLLDVRMPGMDGLALHQALKKRGVTIPAVFISGHGDIPMAVRAVNAGALDFIEKPFDDEALLERIARAFELDRRRSASETETTEIRRRLERLTPRERDVLRGIIAGRLNKQIADDLDISVRTVELHRGRVLEKLEAANAADLVRMVLPLETPFDSGQ
ncbi:MAG: response regulator transcription factor [Wenzhouxiangellaceae bacterium]|nr:response regulator transcription factor [Wenzhouxiangellaceae bacterium]